MDVIMRSLYFFESHHPFHPLSTPTSDNSQSVLKELFLALQDIVSDPSQILNDWKLLLFLLWWRCTFLSNYQMLCTGSLGWGGNRALWQPTALAGVRTEARNHSSDDKGSFWESSGIPWAHPVNINPLSHTLFTPWTKSMRVETVQQSGWRGCPVQGLSLNLCL